MSDGIVKIRRGLPRTNKAVILPEQITWLKQSNLVSSMAHDFTVIQMRVLILVVEKLQQEIERSINSEQLSLFTTDPDRIRMEIPYKSLGVSPENYDRVKEVLKKLQSAPVEFDMVDPETGDEWTRFASLFIFVDVNKRYDRNFRIDMDLSVAHYFFNMSKGFTQYIKEITFRYQSVYTIRIYWMICSWKKKGGFSVLISRFRKQFKLEKKYPEFKDLYRYIIKPAYVELFENADCWFEFTESYRRPEDTEPYKLNFKVIKGVLSVAEKEKLEKVKENVKNLLTMYLSFQERHLDVIIPLIDLDNAAVILVKIGELRSYVDENYSSIHSIPDYCLESLLKKIAPKNDIGWR